MRLVLGNQAKYQYLTPFSSMFIIKYMLVFLESEFMETYSRFR